VSIITLPRLTRRAPRPITGPSVRQTSTVTETATDTGQHGTGRVSLTDAITIPPRGRHALRPVSLVKAAR
jgi:hypothetical protein